jgi:hypothetical protein
LPASLKDDKIGINMLRTYQKALCSKMILCANTIATRNNILLLVPFVCKDKGGYYLCSKIVAMWVNGASVCDIAAQKRKSVLRQR